LDLNALPRPAVEVVFVAACSDTNREGELVLICHESAALQNRQEKKSRGSFNSEMDSAHNLRRE
jgi:hypothetical protein